MSAFRHPWLDATGSAVRRRPPWAFADLDAVDQQRHEIERVERRRSPGIIKNLVLISAGIVVGATVRGGRIVPDPKGRG